MEDYKTSAEPRTMIGDIPVFCAYDDLVDIGKMVPNPKNPNQHPPKQIEALSKIIKAQGWRQPITVSNRSGFIVKGHGRLQAAFLIGADKVPVDFQNYATEAEEIADLTADNRIAELAEIDNTLLADILNDFNTGEMPFELTGYTEEDLEGIIEAIAGEDDAEPNDQDDELEQPLPPMCKKGDLWILGEHRLICGDSTDGKVIDTLMDGEKAAMVHTDPPYGVSYTGGTGTKQKDGSRKSKWEEEAWDTYKSNDDFINNLLVPVFDNYRKNTIEGAAFYIWHPNQNRRSFEIAMEKTGLKERQYLIWYKDSLILGHCDYQISHEPCFYASKEGETPNWYGDRKQESVLVVTGRQNGMMETVIGNGLVLTDGKGAKLYITKKQPKDKKVRYIRMEDDTPLYLYDEDKTTTIWQADRQNNPLHPTQKPVELPLRAIENSSQPGEIVLDFFGGSGSTLLGAELTGRRCFTAEISPCFCDVIISRYVMETGNIGVTCIRDGKEYSYIDLVREWAAKNGKEEEINAMRTPVVVIKKIVTVGAEEEVENTQEAITHGRTG